MQPIELNERAGDETDDAPTLKRWSKPTIRPLRMLATKGGTKSGSVDEDTTSNQDSPIYNYQPQS